MSENQTVLPDQSNPWPRRLMIAGGALMAVILLGAMAFKIFQPIQVLPRIRLAPGFSWTDQDGQRLTNEDLRGKLVLYTFFYTHCPPEACAAQNRVMGDVQRRLGELEQAGVPVRLVSVSVDTERDTPQALSEYARAAGADPQVWRFASAGDPRLLKTVVGGGFEVFYQPQPDGAFQLDPVFVLVDGWGLVRGEYRYTTLSPESDRIIRHLGVLIDEVQNSSGANRLAYEAAHLFLCYSP
ncbi:MAG: SCO family protein [Chloroflexota bacterium]